MKLDFFQSCGHCWVFQICGSTFTASSFRIWNSSSGIPSPPLVLFVVMLFKAHLTSHSRMSGSRWMITPSWLSGSLIKIPRLRKCYYHSPGFGWSGGQACKDALNSEKCLGRCFRLIFVMETLHGSCYNSSCLIAVCSLVPLNSLLLRPFQGLALWPGSDHKMP